MDKLKSNEEDGLIIDNFTPLLTELKKVGGGNEYSDHERSQERDHIRSE